VVPACFFENIPLWTLADTTACLFYSVRQHATSKHMEGITMKSKILTLPICGGTGEVSPVNQCQDSIGTLMDTTIKQFQDGMEMLMDAANDLPEDLLLDSGVSGAAAENWNRYKKIVRGIFAADDAGWGLLQVKYRQAPSLIDHSASVTITLRKKSTFTSEARTALAMATMLSDEVATTTDRGRVQICFTVYGIHATDTTAKT